MNLGKRISLVLKALGKKPIWLCEHVEGLEIGTLSALITRDSTRSVFAIPIAKATGARIEYLLDGELPMFPQASSVAPGKIDVTGQEAQLLQWFRDMNETGRSQILQIAQGLSVLHSSVRPVTAKNKA